ncbi:MAG: CRISPR-associated DxTHG motif protein [Thaumarchaeota archaeon]|nr:CRISPR-associated DxTHG motif protein [Nitrososphaerota archaeon]
MRRLLIATWGSPARWGTAYYILRDGDKILWEGESCTTLVPMVEGLCTENCDTVVVTLDSLVDLGSDSPRERNACYTCSEGCKHLLGGTPRSYAELRGAVERFITEVVKCLGVRAQIRTVVAPAVGSPGGVWKFSGKAEDFESVVLYELGSMVLNREYDEIVLDLTHGINFMPALTLRIAYRLASILLVAYRGLSERGIRILVYNSDPHRYDRDGSKRFPVNVNLIARDLVKSIQLVHRIPRPVKPLRRLEGGLREEIEKLDAELFKVLRLAYPALYYPLPLVLCSVVKELGSPLPTIEKVFRLWLDLTEVSYTSVSRALSINPDAVYALLLIGAVAKRLNGIEYPTPVRVLQELSELYSSVHPSYYYLINDEVSHLREVESRVVSAGRWVRYCEVHRDGCRKVEKPDLRTMVAHAGLQKEFVEIDASTRLRYVRDVSWILSNTGLKLIHGD